MGTEIVKFQFHDDALGIDFSAQLKRIKRFPWAKRTVVMTAMVAADGKTREQATIDIRKVPMLLATIDTNRCKLAVRGKLELYQEEAAEALADRFLGRRGETNERVALLETHVIELMRRIADRPNGLLGPGARDLRARIAMVSEQRSGLDDPNASLTAVDNEVRMFVGYPRTRGNKWEHCPAEVATRAHSYVAAQIDTLDKRIKKHGKRLPNSRQLALLK